MNAGYASITNYKAEQWTCGHKNTLSGNISPYNEYVVSLKSRGSPLRDFDDSLFTHQPLKNLRVEMLLLKQLNETSERGIEGSSSTLEHLSTPDEFQ